MATSNTATSHVHDNPIGGSLGGGGGQNFCAQPDPEVRTLAAASPTVGLYWGGGEETALWSPTTEFSSGG